MRSVAVTATRWELAVDGEVVTQCRTFAGASQQVRDYLDTTDPDTDHSDWAITVFPDGDELTKRR